MLLGLLYTVHIAVWKYGRGAGRGVPGMPWFVISIPTGGGGQIMPTPLKMPPPLPDFWTFRHLCVDLPANKDEACFCHVACYSLCCCKNSRIIFFSPCDSAIFGWAWKTNSFWIMIRMGINISHTPDVKYCKYLKNYIRVPLEIEFQFGNVTITIQWRRKHLESGWANNL